MPFYPGFASYRPRQFYCRNPSFDGGLSLSFLFFYVCPANSIGSSGAVYRPEENGHFLSGVCPAENA